MDLELIRHCSFWLLCSYVFSHLTCVLNLVFCSDLHCFSWFLIFVLPSLTYTIVRSRLRVPTEGKAVLITGCDSGFGFTLAKNLYDQGCTVFAGCLFADKGGSIDLAKIDQKRLHVIQLDVTSQDQIDAAVKYVSNNLPDPNKGLWAVVNNAGTANFGYVEWLSLSQYKSIAEINLWGTIRVTQAFLPLIRKAKGRVINMASMLAVFSKAARSAYGVTKYAVEAFSDSLRYEMRPFGVTVCIVEPGNFTSATSIWGIAEINKQQKFMWNENMSDEVKSTYTNLFNSEVNNMKSFVTSGYEDQSLVVGAYMDAILHLYPYERYRPSDLYHHIMMWIAPHIPEIVFEKMFFSTRQL